MGRSMLLLAMQTASLNPYSNGSTTMGVDVVPVAVLFVTTASLNPYSNGSTTMGLI